ncbi:hypothetical protein N0V83_002448 [Neocucurbitaria cava]|uniref:Uncharacterized protein n=1 Tax=Neocucurbitaria cava TaxID=798079 RepID=A0A9W8YHI1_9PLEO|nr:hypothetical protein N0V83_002448 [Neocucurbitaria cava]
MCKAGTASFTSLTIYGYEACALATEALLRWPAALSHLDFDFGRFYRNPHPMTYAMFTSWLLPHSSTLKTVSISYLDQMYPHANDDIFDATLFPYLESLQLSRHAFPLDLHFRSCDSKILGPSVRRFTWDFTTNDSNSEKWTAFGEQQEQWLAALVAAAAEQKAALREIAIMFCPDPWDLEPEWGYPWDRMVRLRDGVAAEKGIVVSWDEPPLSREAWLEQVERGQEEHEHEHKHENEHVTRTGSEMEPAASSTMAASSENEHEFACLEPFQPDGDIRDYFPPRVDKTQ